MTAIAAKFITGKDFSTTLRITTNEVGPTFPAEFLVLRIVGVVFWALHLALP
jgi:hypothetical protein